MKQITKQELIERINNVKGTTIVSIDIESEPRMRKTDNPYIGATKSVTLSGVVNFSYENAVNNQLEREDKERNFKSQERAWGTYDGNWITHKGSHYLQIKVQASSDPIYMFDGNEIDKNTIKDFLYESKKAHTQEELDKEVVIRDVKIDNIKKIRAFGDEYIIV